MGIEELTLLDILGAMTRQAGQGICPGTFLIGAVVAIGCWCSGCANPPTSWPPDRYLALRKSVRHEGTPAKLDQSKTVLSIVAATGQLVVAVTEEPISVYDARSLRVLRRMPEHRGPVAVNSDASLIAACVPDGVELSRFKSGESVRRFTDPEEQLEWPRQLVFAPNSSFLVALDDHTLVVWSLETGEKLHGLFSGGDIMDAVVTNDSQWLVLARGHCTEVRDAGSGKLLGSIGAGDFPQELDLSPDGRVLGVWGRGLHLWDTRTWTRTRKVVAARGIVAWDQDRPGGSRQASLHLGHVHGRAAGSPGTSRRGSLSSDRMS